MADADKSPVRIPYSYVHEHYRELYSGRLPPPPGARYQCPCCDCYTFDRFPESAVADCPVCGWTFDMTAQKREVRGANNVSLEEARSNFAARGATEPKREPYTRPPRPEEMP